MSFLSHRAGIVLDLGSRKEYSRIFSHNMQIKQKPWTKLWLYYLNVWYQTKIPTILSSCDGSRSNYGINSILLGFNHEPMCKYIFHLPKFPTFIHIAVMNWCACLCVTIHTWTNTLLTSFMHIICFSPFLCRKPWFPGVILFIIRGIEKKMWSSFFFFLPFFQWWVLAFEEELCH